MRLLRWLERLLWPERREEHPELDEVMAQNNARPLGNVTVKKKKGKAR